MKRVVLVLSLLSGPAVPTRAQDGDLRRPRLQAAADTNDWQAYFDFAAANLPARPSVADAGFYWAGRLAPERGEPFLGRWVAYWLRNLTDWEDHQERKREPPGAAVADSMWLRSRWRNPLIPPTLEVLVYDRLPGRWGDAPLTRGLLAYAAGRHEQAAELWTRAIKSGARRSAWLRFNRAGLLAQGQRWDEAVADLDTLAAQLQPRDNTARQYVYESREIIYHALGMLHLARNDAASARQALERALTENLGYAPAHATLGEAALAARNATGAVTELAQAVELAPDDVWFRHRLGVALIAARQGDSAIAVLSDVNRREPFFADAYFDLGRAKEQRADPAGARMAYQAYLARAPQREVDKIQLAGRRLAALAP